MSELKTMTPEEFQKRIDRVLTRLGIRFPFFCQVMASRKIVCDESISTLATDGPTIYCNPNFWVNELTPETEISGIAHELLHIVLEHMWRRGDRDPRLFNIAADFKVNQYLQEEGFTLDPKWLRDPQYDAMSEEQIYALLDKQSNDKSKGGKRKVSGYSNKEEKISDMQPDFEDIREPQGTSEEQAKDKEDIRGAIIRAFNTYKAQGNVGGLAQYLADKVTKVSEPWYEHMLRYMTKMTMTESNWRRINRRELLRTGVIAADIGRPTIELAVVVVDTSGSIGRVTLDYFSGHINTILDSVKPKVIKIIYCDSNINKVDEFSSDDFPIRLEVIGGGGTDFRPAFDYIDKMDAEPDVVVYLTDTYGDYPKEPSYPVIWASIYSWERSTKPPFGEFIFIDESQ